MPPTVLALVLLWQQPATLDIGNTYEGSITESSPEVHTEVLDANYTNDVTRGLTFHFTAAEAGPHFFDLQSLAFDAYLILASDDGTQLAEDDDSLYSTHARIVWSLQAGQSYILQACALHGDTGKFTLHSEFGSPAILTDAERQEQLLKDYLDQISNLEELHGPNSLELSDLLIDVGYFFYDQGNYTEAVPLFRRTLQIRVEGKDSEYPKIFEANMGLSNALAWMGEDSEALKFASTALRICKNSLADDDPEIAYCFLKIGGLHEALEEHETALEKYENSYQLYKRADDKYASKKIRAARGVADQLKVLGRYKESLIYFRDALATIKEIYPEDRNNLAVGFTDVGKAFQRISEFQKAEEHLRESLSLHKAIEGPEGRNVCVALANLADVLVDLGRYDEAAEAFRDGSRIANKIFPSNSSNLAAISTNYGDFLRKIGLFDEAVAELEKALTIVNEIYGTDHVMVTKIKSVYATTLFDMGQRRESEQAFLEVLQSLENHYGPEHPTLISILLNLGSAYKKNGKSEDAERVIRRALEIAETNYGKDHFKVTSPLGSLATLCSSMDRYEEARLYASRSLEISKATLGEHHPNLAGLLTQLAGICSLSGEYVKGMDLFQQAITILENNFGANHPRTATAYANFGLFLRINGNHLEGEKFYRKALASYLSNEGGGKQINQMAVMVNLASALADAGQFEEARRLAEDGLELAIELGGEDQNFAAGAMNILSQILLDQGDLIEAEKMVRRALAIRESIYGEEHSDVALLYSNLAGMVRRNGNLEESRRLYEKALEIRRRVFGENSRLVAETINNLASHYGSAGDYETEMELLIQSQRIFDDTIGPQSHNSLMVQLNRANCHASLKQDQEALEIFLQVAAGLEQLHGQVHPSTIYAKNQLAIQYFLTDHREEALQLSIQVLENMLEYLEAELPTMSEAGRLRMLAKNGDPYFILSGLIDTDTTATHEHFDLFLSWKGKATRLQEASLKIRQEDGDLRLREMLGELQVLAKNLSTLVLLPVSEQKPNHAEQIAGLRAQRLDVERQINAKVGLDKFMDAPTARQIQQVMPADSVLIDFYADKEVFAWVMRKEGPPALFDLGNGQELRELQNEFLQMQAVRGGRKLEAGEVDHGVTLIEKLWQPLAGIVGDAKLVFLSPDDFLCELPFGILQQADGSFLLEKHRFVYASDSTRLVTDEINDPNAEGSLLAVGGVNYFRRDDAPTGSVEQVSTRSRVGSSWSSLPATREELQFLRDLHGFVLEWKSSLTVIEGKAATEERIRVEMPGKRYVHIATHGYFEPDHLPSLLLDAKEGQSETQLGEQIHAVGLLPGLLSGLVLAGVNADADPTRDDGYLSAEEIQHLDLSACDLVVLSACETALGSSRAGEGLMSLRRAFSVAGADTVLSSLWKVDDLATAELMKYFYTNLWEKGLSRSEALHQAKLRMLKRNRLEEGDPKPSTWGAFVLSGEWN
ncbi:MAG: CHAT domain-containing protein [Planctomycetes bacterium]|nr:CHAT domain-containing protein [Planctomycetota bacterium]